MLTAISTATRRAIGTARPMSAAARPGPGVIGLDIHLPASFVDQARLERHDAVAAGKYTAGLGQQQMAFVDTDEDVQSMALTATRRLLRASGVAPRDIGRVEVGTESMVDKSKSVKSALMSLWNDEGVHDVEGVDCLNACYGGTAALFNSLAWMHSPEYDGRLALVLAGDIAVYPPGPARPTGGAGMVALLLGPDAPLRFDPVRHSHMEHAYDFYKPHMDSEYPLVDGHLSNACYRRALEGCWDGYSRRFADLHGHTPTLGEDIDYLLFHQPYQKLVRKSFAALWGREAAEPEAAAQLWGSADLYDRMVEPGTRLGRRVGNLYAGSLYASLISLLCHAPLDQLPGRRIALFSYGSGLTSSLFSATVAQNASGWLRGVRRDLRLDERLDRRSEASPAEYAAAMLRRERQLPPRAADPARRRPGVTYLESIDPDTRHRAYRQEPASSWSSSPSPPGQAAAGCW